MRDCAILGSASSIDIRSKAPDSLDVDRRHHTGHDRLRARRTITSILKHQKGSLTMLKSIVVDREKLDLAGMLGAYRAFWEELDWDVPAEACASQDE